MSESRYRAVKAYENLPWIHSRTARPMRILAEYLEPEARFEEMKIEDTIVVFGSAIGSRMTEIDGVAYGAFIVPGLIMMTLLTQSVMNASFGIYFPRFVGTIFEILSAPISYFEIVIGYVGAAATKAIMAAAE